MPPNLQTSVLCCKSFCLTNTEVLTLVRPRPFFRYWFNWNCLKDHGETCLGRWQRLRPKSSWLRQFKASWRIVEPQGFFDATLVGKKQKQKEMTACHKCVFVCQQFIYVNFPSKYRRMQTCRYQQRLCTQAQSLRSWKICCMTLMRYKGTFSPQFHAFGYEGRAGMLGPLLTPHTAKMQSAS